MPIHKNNKRTQGRPIANRGGSKGPLFKSLAPYDPQTPCQMVSFVPVTRLCLALSGADVEFDFVLMCIQPIPEGQLQAVGLFIFVFSTNWELI